MRLGIRSTACATLAAVTVPGAASGTGVACPAIAASVLDRRGPAPAAASPTLEATRARRRLIRCVVGRGAGL